jgi:putative PEP-CTERM system histidine kinase
MGKSVLFGYLLSALAYIALPVIAKYQIEAAARNRLLILVSAATVIWAVILTYQAYGAHFHYSTIYFAELIKFTAWLGFMVTLLWLSVSSVGRNKLLLLLGLACIAAMLSSAGILIYTNFPPFAEFDAVSIPLFSSFIILSIAGLIFVEQLFRNTPHYKRWSIKFLCIAVGALFAYDFYMYSDALLMRRVDENIWGARGYIYACVMPLIAISALRTRRWSTNIQISKNFVFHTATLFGAGLYLVAMAAGGYYIRIYGGTWGSVAQILFLFGAAILLGLLLFSGYARAKLKIFLAKHFFRYKYDYREEWLRLIKSMSNENSAQKVRYKAITALADIVESPAGMLWIRDSAGNYALSVNWNMPSVQETVHSGGALPRFFGKKEWVVDLDEVNDVPELYNQLRLPEWLANMSQSWLIVPLMHQNNLMGFVILARSRVPHKINWEDRDLLLTVARQVTSYLALVEANEELFNTRQFDAFNRLSAYVVHDLKNLVAQLALVTSNAAKHKHNPAFMEDAMMTVESATAKMRKMLQQLRKGASASGELAPVSIAEVLKEVVRLRSNDRPIPVLICEQQSIRILANRDRLISVLEHVVQNAQEATQGEGEVKVTLSEERDNAVISVEDNGCGMDEKFVQERLFKPFQTTKGNAGMGIGVYEGREYVHSMGGSMTVTSELGNGTAFFIRFPIYSTSELDTVEARKVG